MSRVGKQPVPVPSGVDVTIGKDRFTAKGKVGTVAFDLVPEISVEQQDGQLLVKRQQENRRQRALHGLYRSLVNNAVTGAATGFEKKLEIVGVGYGAELKGKSIALKVGFSNTVVIAIPDGVTVELASPTSITIKGADKQKVGQMAAEIRAVRKPEPYKGTGIKYSDEVIRRKSGKAFGSGG